MSFLLFSGQLWTQKKRTACLFRTDSPLFEARLNRPTLFFR
uniref:Uncharacterized protein n=1 Tax=Faecalibaculum rodentium TaxID=1702221 RepID=A0A140DSJ8_9FIRM|nr:hypothetical protein AALO17_04910 [Faecalibaculum rodentium]